MALFALLSLGRATAQCSATQACPAATDCCTAGGLCGSGVAYCGSSCVGGPCTATSTWLTSKTNVMGYWGQSTGSSLSTFCSDSTYNILTITYLSSFGPSGLSLSIPAASCTGQSCLALATDITTCQSAGKLIFLALGGPAGTSGTPAPGFGSDTAAQAAADDIWNAFFGGSGSTRPFGSVRLDGVDLAFMQPTTSQAAFVARLKSNFAGSRKYYIGASPSCTFPDPVLGPNNGGAIDSALDFVAPRFYSQSCGADAFSSNGMTFTNWNYWARNSANSRISLLIGLAASSNAASSGFVSVSTVEQILYDYVVSPNFGGVVISDVVKASINNYGSEVSNAVRGASYGATTPPGSPIGRVVGAVVGVVFFITFLTFSVIFFIRRRAMLRMKMQLEIR